MLLLPKDEYQHGDGNDNDDEEEKEEEYQLEIHHFIITSSSQGYKDIYSPVT